MSAIPNPTPGTRYQFAGVVLDSERRSVWVDGRPVGCSGKAFALLLCLAERPRQALPRDVLIDQVWPGGQVVSDEALTQLVFRARAVLGSHGGLIKTVRGVGFELEADVELVEFDPAQAVATAPTLVSAPSTDVDPAPGSDHASRAQPRGHWPLWAAGTALLAFCVGLWWSLARPGLLSAVDPVLNQGYGLLASDLGGTTDEQRQLIAQAMLRDDLGERQRAQSLMVAASDSLPDRALPATMLALWHLGSGHREGAEEWMRRAQERLAGSTAYEHLLFNYVATQVDFDPERTLATAGALLDLRPNAWRMRHARSHMYEYRGQREAALQELRGIEIPQLGLRKRDTVIADIASFGDLAYAEAQLRRLADDPDRSTWCFLQGRLAWTRGDWSAAADWFGQSVDQATRDGQQDLRSRAASYQGAALVLLGDDQQALAYLERARSLIGDRQPGHELDLTVLIAILRAGTGDAKQSDEEITRARALLATVPAGDNLEAARLALLRLTPQQPPPTPLLPESGAEIALWEAALAYAQGQKDTAATRLNLAIQRGIGQTRLEQNARWLQRQLGLPLAPPGSIDPPFPPLSRLTLHRELDSR